MSYVTGVTGVTETPVLTHKINFDMTFKIGHEVEVAENESKNQRIVA